MSLLQKLLNIQNELKAPKGQYNSFGKYKYRSCEDILEAVKPLCKKNNLCLTLSDDIVFMGSRYYVKATASLVDIESGENYVTTAFAREDENKKGMDGSQITGASSSYARKYALNGLFNIDDTKDADTDEYAKQGKNKAKQEAKVVCPVCGKQIQEMKSAKGTVWKPEQILKQYGMCCDCWKSQQGGNT